MIISYKYKFVFIHIPKTAGTLIKNIIVTKIDPDCKLYVHHTINDIINMDIYEKIKDFKFFTIIRNPLDLIISNYNYIITEKIHYLHNKITNFNYYIDYISNNPHFYTNLHFVTKNDGEIDFNNQSYQQLCKRAANGWDINLASRIFKQIFEQLNM